MPRPGVAASTTGHRRGARCDTPAAWSASPTAPRNTSAVLEDGLWLRHERAEKSADARARGARVALHVLNVPVELLWHRLLARNQRGEAHHHPISRDALARAAALFEPPGPEELAGFDEVHQHGPGRPHAG